MGLNIYELMNKEKIEKFKIMRMKCNKKSYSLIYGNEEWKSEELTTYLVRFLWKNEIKEIKIVSEKLNITRELLRYIKEIPGIVNIGEDFELSPPALICCEKKEKEFEIQIQDLLSKIKDSNIVIDQERYCCKWYSYNEEFRQEFVKYRVLYLNLLTNKFIDYTFEDEKGWKYLHKMMFKYNTQYLKVYKKSKQQMFELDALAMSKILKKIVMLFYADQIYYNRSFFEISDLGKKFFSDYINLYSIPIDRLYFDAEGNQIKKRCLIRDGEIKDILSNSYFAMKLNTFSGNAGLVNKEEIEGYLIQFDTVVKRTCVDSFVKILDFETINIEKDMIKGVAICDNGEIYKLQVDISIFDFINNVMYINEEFSWIERCWTTNAVIEM